MNPSDEIWEGDQLQRRGEAVMLQQFLNDEVGVFEKQARRQAYVLALDAQYGEGKSWFLERLAKQLRLNHPVAFVDAWVDDANEEPFVAIMSAIEEALSPYLAKDKKLAASFKAATRAALPIIGKMSVGAATKLSQRYLGDAIGSDIADELAKAENDKQAIDPQVGALEEAVSEGVAKIGEAIGSLVDKQAEAMLTSYRERKRSRAVFKTNMTALTARISDSGTGTSPPLFVIVDELDRCRPNYAIKLLEEVKHFFDVPGVVFIIALHGAQLTKSISAVYGAEFDSQSYLQRFFSRRYEMRRLSVRELVGWLMGWWNYDDTRLERPHVQGEDQRPLEVSAADYAGRFLEEFNVTPRECFAVIDALRIFCQKWEHKTPIELTWALILIVLEHRNMPNLNQLPKQKHKMRMLMPVLRGGHQQHEWAEAHVFVAKFWEVLTYPLPDVPENLNSDGPGAYMKFKLAREFVIEHGSGYQTNSKPFSVWRDYWDKITEIGRFTNTGNSAQ